jgi:hypothetical protein
MANITKVIKIQCPFERIKKYNATPESALYKAVIMQMIIDASNVSKDPKASLNEKRAKAWLFANNEDFQTVCIMAEIDPQVVVRFAKELIAMHHEKIAVKNASLKRKNIVRSQTKKKGRSKNGLSDYATLPSASFSLGFL